MLLLLASNTDEKVLNLDTENSNTESVFAFPFDTKSPDATFEMPDELFEISGLSVTTDGKHLVAIQDENGIIFKINVETGAVDQKIPFWKDGDYEGVEVVGNDVYVVKSTGTIYRIRNLEGENQEVVKFKYFLDKDNDVEGLGLDVKNGRLLVACKAKAGTGEHMKKKKGIYAFDFNREQMDTVPALVISQESVIKFLQNNPELPSHEKLTDFFVREDGKFKFSPSAIAIHPVTEEIYITSSVGKMMLVLNAQGDLIHMEKLKKSIHPQPEGLCFDKDGNMYIANEGKDDTALIYKYNYRP